MSVDATTVRHLCPFCDEDFSTERKVREHITHEEDDEHRGTNGFTMNRTIETKQDSSRLPLHNKIVKAADKFDTLSYQQAEKVARAADVSKYRVLRVWDEEGFNLSGIRSDTSLYFDELSELQQKVLAQKYKNPEKSERDIESELGASHGSTSAIRGKKGYLLEDRYRPENLDGKSENITDASNSESDEEEAEMKEVRSIIAALDDSDVEFTIEISTEEDSFDVLESLISNGHSDLAREYFENGGETLIF